MMVVVIMWISLMATIHRSWRLQYTPAASALTVTTTTIGMTAHGVDCEGDCDGGHDGDSDDDDDDDDGDDDGDDDDDSYGGVVDDDAVVDDDDE
eukprot:6440059-Pyramimonas_sp.AAC.1